MSKPQPADTAAQTPTTASNVMTLPAKAEDSRPSTKVVAFVKRHPLLIVAGGLAVGAAVSALLPRRTTRRWFGRAVDIAQAAGASTVLFGREAGDKAQDFGHDAGKRAKLLSRRAEKASETAIDSLEKYGLAALAAASSLGRATAHKAGKFGEAAAEQSGRALHKAQDKAQEVQARFNH